MDDMLSKRKEVFFNNLVLLGLDQITFEKKYGISFHKDMFVLPNKKGYEVVTHFLFTKLSNATGVEYNIPWPLLSKEHERAFQKTCFSHFTKFSQENSVKFPRIVQSLLSTFGGDRFYEVYLAFSCYVLQKTIRKNRNINLLSRPCVSRENVDTAKDVLQLSTILHMKKFRDTENMTYTSQCIWLRFAKILEECLQKLKQLLKTNEDLILRNKKTFLSLYSIVPEENLNIQKMMETSFEYLKPVIEKRKVLHQFFAAEEKYWQYLSSEVGENVVSEFLNGQDYDMCVTANLPEEYHKELENVGCCSSKDSGKLSVVKFMKLFMAYVRYITDLLNKADLTKLHETCYVEHAASIEDDLNSIKNVNKKLSEEVIPDLEENIKKLKLANCLDDHEGHMEGLSNQFSFSLPVQNFDVEAVKERSSHFDCSLERIFQLPYLETQTCNERCYDDEFASHSSSATGFSFMDETLGINDTSIFNTAAHTAVSNSAPSTSSTFENIFSETVQSGTTDVPLMNPHLSSKLSIPSLDNVDFEPSTNFKMRQSWLHEESLNAMTLPDISFDD